MTVQTVAAASGGSALSNAVRTRYLEDYIRGAQYMRLYDQLASPVGQDMSRLAKGSSVTLNFLSDMTPGTSAIPETVDITPQALTDATTTVTPTSRAEALQGSELLLLQAYTNYGSERFEAVGKNMMESVEILARDVATQGSWVFNDASTATLTTLDSGCTSHRANDALFTKVSTFFATAKVPGWETEGGQDHACILHPNAWHDIREDGNVQTIAQYQKAEILLQHEFGAIGRFRLVVSPWAKVLGGAGAAADTDAIALTLACQAEPLDTSFTVSTTTHLDSQMSQWWVIGSTETRTCHYPTNELVYALSHATKVVSCIGEGANGGLRFQHLAGVRVSNADHIYLLVFGGPESLAKIYQPSIGEYGMPVGPKLDGIVDQFWTLGWKFYGGYGRIAENRLLRVEVTASVDDK
jgi:N4-gp56 family major capsid protein